MSTKDNYPLLFKDKQKNVTNNGQYSNLTLKKNHQISADTFAVSSKNVVTQRRTAAPTKLSDFTNDSQTIKEFHSWKKSTNDLSLNFANNSSEKKDRLKKEKALTASTLSLCIEAYENSNEANLCDVTKKDLKKIDLIKKGLNPKQIYFDSTVIIQNPFEFSRQQENGEAVTPEISQYSAAQQLLNPNLQTHQTHVQQALPQNSAGRSIDEPTTEGAPLNRDEVECLASELVRKHEIVDGRKGGSYKIMGKLGRGSFGCVFLIESIHDSNIQAALKIVQTQTIIEVEETVLKKAYDSNSEHICKLIDSGCTKDGMEFVIMDLLGNDLSQFITAGTSLKIKIKVAQQCLIATEALHTLGYLHRDIKPNNFVLGRKGSDKEYVVIMIDFGMAESIKGDIKSCTGTEIYGSIAGWEDKLQGAKDDLESWFYMLIEWIRGLPWTTEENEEDHLQLKRAIRDDQSEICKEFFGEYDPRSLKKDDYFMDLAKIMRYIDSLQFNNVPDYNRIHYFLHCAYRDVCVHMDKYNKEQPSKLTRSEGRQAKEEFLAKLEQEEKDVAYFERFSRRAVEQPANLAFFSSIIYEENEKYVKNIEYFGVSLNLCYQPATPNQLVFKCTRCINSQPCGLKVCIYFKGTERTWEEARIEKVEGDRNNCQKLKTFNEALKLHVEGKKSSGE